MNTSSPRATESLYQAKPQRLKNSKTKHFLFLAVIGLIVLSSACGRRRTHVQLTLPRIPPATQTQSTEPPPNSPSPSHPKPSDSQNAPDVPVAEPSATQTDAETSTADVSRGPTIRIGLMTSASEIRISSSGNFYFMAKTPEADRQLVQGEVRIRVESAAGASVPAYKIQVAAFKQAENAEGLKKKLAGTFDVPVFIHNNSSGGTRQVRVGNFSNRKEAEDFLKTLVASGYRDAYIITESVANGSSKTTLALRGPGKLFNLSQSGFLFLPSTGANFLCVDGKPYRGLLDIILNDRGSITVVNQLAMEDYLLGVVPAEINPTKYPEFAALAAQSIAARSYALFNMGKYRSEGFDLTDDTNTQVYFGASGEKKETSDAVRRTSGLAVYYKDKVIEALYMSTCGGKTEDSSNVFGTPPVPYLKSVFCAIDSGPEKGEIIIEGKHALEQTFVTDDGTVANRNVEFAQVLGLIGSGVQISQEFLSAPIERDEAVHWIEKARKVAHKDSHRNPRPKDDITTRSGFIRYAAESFFDTETIKKRISKRDVEYFTGNLKDGSSLSEADLYALTYLMQNGLWRPYADNTIRPDDTIRRGDALSLLLRWVESSHPEVLRKGTFMEADSQNADSEGDSRISVKWGNRARDFRLSEKPYLFRQDQDRITPVNSLRIIGNEKMAFHVNESGAIDFLEIELNPTGTASDRHSPVSTWEVTIKRSAMAEKLRSLAGNIGEFEDLKPYKLGNSPRVVQIQVIGSSGSKVINGNRVRGALGLKDTWFTIAREYDPNGKIESFTFYGRGWGHRVGLCQTGAFGMARAGRSYEEILKTYYTGVEIRKAY